MAEKVSIKVPAHLASFVKPDAANEEKLRVVSGDIGATPPERATLLFFLCYDKIPEVKSAALAAMRGLPTHLLVELASSPSTHPRMLDLLARLHGASTAISSILLERDDLLPLTSEFLAQLSPPVRAESVEDKAEVASEDASAEVEGEAPENAGEGDQEEEEETAEEEAAEEEEEFKSKYQLAQIMGVGEKIKTALTGDKEWRSLLIKDSNKLVNGAVVKNPRITEAEILTISKSVIQNDEIIRVICHNKEWVKNYEIRKALVLNNKTPLPVALRFMSTLSEKDVATIAKSKNVSSVLCNNARRMLSSKKKS